MTATSASSLAPSDLAGAWRLVRFVYRWPDGHELAPLGEVDGQLLYLLDATAPGRMSVQVVARVRPPFDMASEASLAAHFQSGFAYAGRWSLAGERIHHDVDMASLGFWEGTRLTRQVQLQQGRLILTTDQPSPQLPQGGYTTILEWVRV